MPATSSPTRSGAPFLLRPGALTLADLRALDEAPERTVAIDDAAWPAVCIRTGEPAVGWFPTKISRTAPGSWLRTETIRFRLPVGRRWHWLTTRLREIRGGR